MIETIAELRAELRGRTVSCVPTMGNLHEGHLALMRIAKRHGDCTVATIFVNRLQFAPTEDFDKYPRTFADDCAKLEREGVDVVFAPDEKEMYPDPQGYKVAPPPELGRHRRGRVPPRVLRRRVHGGAQALQRRAAAGRGVRQEGLPAAAHHPEHGRAARAADHDRPGETSRADDGLALSSRNNYLSAAERMEAPRLYRMLKKTARSIASGGHDYPRLEQEAMAELRNYKWAARLRRRAAPGRPAAARAGRSRPRDPRRGEARQHPADRQHRSRGLTRRR